MTFRKNTTRINKKDALLKSLLWQQLSIKFIEMLDHWKALLKYFHFVSIRYFYRFLLRISIYLNKNFAFSFSQSLLYKKCNPYYIKNAFQQSRASLWKALAPKPFEIQTWDWSRLKDLLKIFKNVSFQKSLIDFLCLFYQ